MIRLPSGNSKSGFALVDVLVALTVTALAGSVLIGLFTFVERSLQVSRELARHNEEIVTASRILRNLTEDAYSVRGHGRGMMLPHGTEREFTIATTGPRILSLLQPSIFTVGSESADGLTRVTLHWVDPATGKEHVETISNGLEHAEFSYFGRPNGTVKRSWHSIWRANSGQLEAVKLTIKPPQYAAIDLIAPLRGNLAVQCIRNPHQPECALREP